MSPRKVVLVYHSVGSEGTPAVVGSFPVPLERFVHQVEQARAAGWDFGRLSDLRRPVTRDTLYITGDDGTVDWAANVLPWCDEHEVPTHTALITGVWQVPPLWPVAHQLQVLLAQPNRDLPVPPLSDDQRAYVDRIYAYETDPRRRYLKGACNVVFDDAQAREFLGEPDEPTLELLWARFAPPSAYRGYTWAEFGAHTVRHCAFDGDVDAYVQNEIQPCLDDLRANGLTPSHYFTFPMRPRYPATIEQIIPALRELGFEGTLEANGEWDQQSFAIPRIDGKSVEEFLGLPPFESGVKAQCAAR